MAFANAAVIAPSSLYGVVRICYCDPKAPLLGSHGDLGSGFCSSAFCVGSHAGKSDVVLERRRLKSVDTRIVENTQMKSTIEIRVSCYQNMVRGKIQMKRIEKEGSRQVTFSKRKNGLLKKAHELSVLCEAQVAVIIFSQKGRLYEFSSSDMKKILERYREYVKDVPANKFEEDFIQKLVFESSSMAKEIELLEHSQRMLLGHGLNSCSLDELQGIEDQLERSLQKIRQRKGQLFREHIEQLKNKERDILRENAKLSEMCGEKSWPQQWVKPTEAAPHSPSSHSLHVVDTELFIGLPEQRC